MSASGVINCIKRLHKWHISQCCKIEITREASWDMNTVWFGTGGVCNTCMASVTAWWVQSTLSDCNIPSNIASIWIRGKMCSASVSNSSSWHWEWGEREEGEMEKRQRKEDHIKQTKIDGNLINEYTDNTPLAIDIYNRHTDTLIY